ncbi:MAG: hypothetical protein V3S16_11395 [Candidatus Desulfatibia sp.]|jgi:hypothetical protein|uniref:hypothetical protein n=1 Tax=Candidatus Desulfatibia sp. TaxID=3101189 RepID=UPI002F2F61DE
MRPRLKFFGYASYGAFDFIVARLPTVGFTNINDGEVWISQILEELRYGYKR